MARRGPEQFLVVGGRRFRLRSQGRGGPTVVLEAGMGQPLETWRLVQPAVARWGRALSYDRAGVGRSDPAPRPRSCADLVSDLHALLEAAGVPRPYVLVGQSLGGLVVRLYAHRFPDDVGGMVLVDAPHPDYPRRALALLPSEAPGECREVAESRRFFAEVLDASDDSNQNTEGIAVGRSLAQVSPAGSLGERPLVVLSAGKTAAFDPDFPDELAARISALVRACQRELVGLSARGEQVVAWESGHMIQLDQPRLVVAAVRAVVNAVRDGATGRR